MRIIIAGTMDFENADDPRQVIEGGRAFIEGALTEKGCVAYDWSIDPNHPGRLYVFEEWTGESALAAHFKSKWYTQMRDNLRKFPRTGADVKKYRIDLVGPVYDDTGTARADFFTAQEP